MLQLDFQFPCLENRSLDFLFKISFYVHKRKKIQECNMRVEILDELLLWSTIKKSFFILSQGMSFHSKFFFTRHDTRETAEK